MIRILSVLPPVLLGLSALFLAASWSQLPETWPIHWGLDGRPNGWAHRTVGSALLPVFLGVGIWLFLEAIAWATERWPVSAPLSEPDARRLKKATADLVRLTATAMTAVFAFLTAALPFHPELGTSRMLPLIILCGIFGTLGLGLVAYGRVFRQLALPPQWRPLGYYDPRDRRLWVPKLLGMGWTINFGHPFAAPALGALLALITLPVILALRVL